MSYRLIAGENINPGDPIAIIKWPLATRVRGIEEISFIASGSYIEGDEIPVAYSGGQMVEVGDGTEFDSDNPKTWPVFSMSNKRYWVWVRSLIYGFVRKIEDAYDLERPRGK